MFYFISHSEACRKTAFACLLALLPCSLPVAQSLQDMPASAEGAPAGENTALAGDWLFNESLSDNTDNRVEAALRAAGQRIERRLFDRREDKYRGGPENQELYDRISYDRELHIDLDGAVYYFTYADQWQRTIYTDNRSRSVSLTGLVNVEDFSLGHWENGKLLVEAHPRDGGVARETYTLIENDARLQVEFYIKPRTFPEAIELTRVYDRQTAR